MAVAANAEATFSEAMDAATLNDSEGNRSGGSLEGMLARVGYGGSARGDEFAVLLEDVADANESVVVAERFLRQLRGPLDVRGVRGHRLSATASIGIAVGAEEKPEELLSKADVAMYQAKRAGKAHSLEFDPSMRG